MRLLRVPLWQTIRACGLLCAVWLLIPFEARAGGGPQNVFLVVNSRSWASLSIANHFASLRQLPATNILYLDWGGSPYRTGIGGFREKILQPVLQAISQRKLADHIDYIVYSSDFPTAVDATSEFEGVTLPPPLNPVGSLTGMTYLAARATSDTPDYLAFNHNHFAQASLDRTRRSDSRGFRSWYGWKNNGELLEAGGRSYMLSVMLGVTSGRGNSVPEVVDYLTRAAGADGTRPGGTIYYALNDDVRSNVRAPNVQTAIDELKRLGVRGEIVKGSLPERRSDVMGLMAGVADFDWPASHSTILPGAICEHLTSFGGAVEPGAGQTPLTEFLRYGAAGSSGTVVEPFAIQAKFPLPQIQVHYARGCSLAEAFYRSVAMPRQLLIVGDPLCRPWARFPTVVVDGLTPGRVISGDLALTPSVAMEQDLDIDRLHWFLDGQLIAHTRIGDRLTLNTRRLPDGAHELRIVAQENSPIESQGAVVLPFEVDNTPGSLALSVEPEGTVRWGEPLHLRVKIEGGAGATIYCSSRPLGQLEGSEGELTLDPRLLGLGPVTLHAESNNGGPPLLSSRIPLQIEPNAPLPPVPLDAGSQLMPGFLVTPQGKKPGPVDHTLGDDWLVRAGVEPQHDFTLSGAFRVATDNVYQFQLRTFGPLKLAVDHVPLFESENDDGSYHYVPVSLAAGLHTLEIAGTAGTTPQLQIAFGRQGTQPLNGDVLRRIVPVAQP